MKPFAAGLALLIAANSSASASSGRPTAPALGGLPPAPAMLAGAGLAGAPDAVRDAQRNARAALRGNWQDLMQGHAPMLQEAAALPRAARAGRLAHALYTLSGAIYANTAAQASLDHAATLDPLRRALSSGRPMLFTDAGRRQTHWHPKSFEGLHESRLESLLGGVLPVSEYWTLGAAVYGMRSKAIESYERATLDTVRGRGHGVLLGARLGKTETGYLDLVAGYGRDRQEVTRNLSLGRGVHRIGAAPELRLRQARLTAGRQWQPASRLALTPELGVALGQGERSAFREAGAGGWGLRAKGSSDTTATLLAGLTAQYRFALASLPMHAVGRLAWQHDLDRRDYRARGGFTGRPLAQARSAQWDLPRGRLQTGVSLQAQVSEALSLGLAYDAMLASGARSQRVGLDLGYAF
ncbi:autotransporter outer membrane beta-barrel domain-containing protein [Bordetella hinzii]|uniref:autotransporter outer membrane beta-barrel domain-containing protein n=1 Tax=Bordetella hinzii TaxID=103855 RepID=UPI0039FDA130